MHDWKPLNSSKYPVKLLRREIKHWKCTKCKWVYGPIGTKPKNDEKVSIFDYEKDGSVSGEKLFNCEEYIAYKVMDK